jgi:integrase
MDSRRDWSWINRIGSRIPARDTPARPKRRRLVAAGELLDLGLELIASAGGRSTNRGRATTYRDGLIIALLAARPLRLGNLAGLVLDHSVVRRGDQWWIQIPAAETKTNSSIELPWPDALVLHLEAYLHHHRPALAGMHGRWTRPAGRALWLSADGSPMTKMAIYDRVIARTRQGTWTPNKSPSVSRLRSHEHSD